MPPKEKSSRTNLWIIGLLFAFVALLIVFMTFSANSTISGTEFSPINFQSRSFHYARIPGTKIRISQTRLTTPGTNVPTEVLKHLRTISNRTVWQVSSISNEQQGELGAKILEASLEQRNADGVSYWGAWSKTNPTAAKVLWPLIQEVALEDFYILVPPLLDAAESETNPRKLASAAFRIIDNRLAEWVKLGPLDSRGENAKRLRIWLDKLEADRELNLDEYHFEATRNAADEVLNSSGK